MREGLQKARGCGYIEDADEGFVLIWRKKDGGFRYHLKECPLSILSRHNDAVRLAVDWQALGSFPLDYATVPMSLWQRCVAIHSEAEWFAHQAEQEPER